MTAVNLKLCNSTIFLTRQFVYPYLVIPRQHLALPTWKHSNPEVWISQIPHPSGPQIKHRSRVHRIDYTVFLHTNTFAIGQFSGALSTAQVIGTQRQMPNVVVKWVSTLLRFLEVANPIPCPQTGLDQISTVAHSLKTWYRTSRFHTRLGIH